MKTLLALLLTIGLTTSANATVKMPVCEVNCAGGLSTLSTASQIVGTAVVGLFVYAAYKSNDYTCKIVKTDPLPGTNYVNEKSICIK